MPQGRQALLGAAWAVGVLWLIIAVSNSFLAGGALPYGLLLLVFMAGELRAGPGD